MHNRKISETPDSCFWLVGLHQQCVSSTLVRIEPATLDC